MDTLSPTIEWYFARNGTRGGPVAVDALRDLLRRGEVQPTDLVWNASMPDWAAASTVPGLVVFAMPPLAMPRIVPPPAPPVSQHGAQPVAAPLGYAGPQPSYSMPPGIGQDAGVRWLMPVGRSGWAIAAGYLGLFSVLMVFAPFALITGCLAVSDIRKNPQRHGMGRAVFGIVMGVIFSAIGVIFLFARARHRF